MIFINMKIILLLCISVIGADAVRSISFPIGGLFSHLTLPSSLQVFKTIVKETGSGAFHGEPLETKVVDSYSTALELCPYTSDDKGVVALIDPRPTNGICDNTCLLCNRYNIPHIALGWEPPNTLEEDLFTFQYYPPPELISKAYAALIKDLQWDKFTILYENEDSFIRLQEIINSWPNAVEPILFRKLDPDGDNREIFKHVFKVAKMNYHVLDCHVNNIYGYMKEIIQVENATEYQSFILTSLDAYTLDLGSIPDLMANVSTLHLTRQHHVKWRDFGMGQDDQVIPLEAALVADSLKHIEKAIASMQNTSDGHLIRSINLPTPPALCYQESKADYESIVWPLGQSLRESMLQTESEGFTGKIEFDENGRRTNIILLFSKLNKDSEFVYAGHWDSRTNLITTENTVKDRSTALKSNSKIRIGTIEGLPYFQTVNDVNGTSYRGFAVDLVNAIFERIKIDNKIEFEYEFYKADSGYGNHITGTKKWNGLIGDLMEHKAGLGVCDLTITSERISAVDFSVPFMTLGISMLFKTPEPQEPDMFSFINPLALDVWLYLATTYIIVSFVLLICARMSQDDWVNPHPCNQNPENLQNIWSLYNCMWLTIGAIMTQGCDILPRAAGSRWIAGMWWFFALIVTASYTANMSTFLSNNRRSNDITNVKELSEQNKVSYGAVFNSSTYKFFQTSNDSVYSKIWTVMESARPTVFMNNNIEGMNRVSKSKGKYAFFMESTAIEYYTQRDCDLKMVGSKLDSKEYGIAMPKNYPHKTLIDHAILSLQQLGTLSRLKKKWWEEEDIAVHCEKGDSEKEDSGSLQMENTSGIFLVLGFGGILGLLVAIIDFLFHVRQISVKERVTFREALVSEWRASLNPRNLHKLAAPPRSAPPSTATPSPERERSRSRAVSVLRAASSFINFDEIY
ncbi:hypothetical protein O3G_MSEX006790 [Manduca sexta]|uniref:Uncharacterized protein n=2 Tax=Manduca sexta TaxID=7130 RepID=A0A922CMI4_MANSE|nr:hypothetical protein O3G_MSEX006790 [Manduca sexta]